MAKELNPLDIPEEEETLPSELEVLKQRAKVLGITYSNNISLEKLRERVAAAQEGDTSPEDTAVESSTESVTTAEPNPLAGDTGTAPVKKLSLRQHLYLENMKLVRIRVTNMDPKKKDLRGEFFTVANEHLGTVRKFVPFGDETEDGYCVPKCIYDMMADRKFLNIRTLKDRRTGVNRVESSYVREFAIEVLPDLTKKELAELAAQQAASGSLKDN